jgi:hypothetical protein
MIFNRFEQLGMKTRDVKAFLDKVQKLYTMKDMGNPFMEETGGNHITSIKYSQNLSII